jgi:hypothetical protein
MPIDVMSTPAHEPALRRRPRPTPTVVLVRPSPGEWS